MLVRENLGQNIESLSVRTDTDFGIYCKHRSFEYESVGSEQASLGFTWCLFLFPLNDSLLQLPIRQ